MTSQAPGTEPLSYRSVCGEELRDSATVISDTEHAPASLIARSLRLADGRQARQLLVDPADRAIGYQGLDNEILAGLRLARLAGPRSYPAQVSRLFGYAADSASPFALLEPYRGETVDVVAGHLLPADEHPFQVSLLTGLSWLAEAGIAHCGIGPSTVRWDGERVQITDFSQATVIGSHRQASSLRPGAGPQQRIDQVSDRGDVLAAGLLIYHVLAGEELSDRDQLADWPGLASLLAGVTGGAPDRRPSARELLTQRLRVRDPVPRGRGGDPRLDEGRTEFYVSRARKHPELGLAESAGAPPSPPPEQDREGREGRAGRGSREGRAGRGSREGRAGRTGRGSGFAGLRRRLSLLIGGLLPMLVGIGLVVWVR